VQKISKNSEPESLKAIKSRAPNLKYADIDGAVRQDIRMAMLQEQYYLCAYCNTLLTGKNDCHNEHVIPQDRAPQITLDYDNIVCSCNGLKQCGDSHKAKDLPLTPLMPECETELKYYLSGRVKGLTDRARETIDVLNLGDKLESNRGLIEKRKQLIESLMWKHGVDPEDEVEDDELLKMLIEDLSTPVNGKLDSFAPVLVNILKQWLSYSD